MNDIDDKEGWIAVLERITDGWHPLWVILLVFVCLIVVRGDKIITAWRSESNQKLTSVQKHEQVMARLNNQKSKSNPPSQDKKG